MDPVESDGLYDCQNILIDPFEIDVLYYRYLRFKDKLQELVMEHSSVDMNDDDKNVVKITPVDSYSLDPGSIIKVFNSLYRIRYGVSFSITPRGYAVYGKKIKDFVSLLNVAGKEYYGFIRWMFDLQSFTPTLGAITNNNMWRRYEAIIKEKEKETRKDTLEDFNAMKKAGKEK
jgi:hypothetical protein